MTHLPRGILVRMSGENKGEGFVVGHDVEVTSLKKIPKVIYC